MTFSMKLIGVLEFVLILSKILHGVLAGAIISMLKDKMNCLETSRNDIIACMCRNRLFVQVNAY